MLRIFDKIDVSKIISLHIGTLRNNADGKILGTDIILFYILPYLLAILLIGKEIYLDNNAVTIVITAFSIFVGLLFNVIVLMFDIVNKKNTDSNKVELLKQLLYNISYAILVSVISIIISLFTYTEIYPWKPIANYVLYFLIFNFLLTVLMILKRTFGLFNFEITAQADKSANS